MIDSCISLREIFVFAQVFSAGGLCILLGYILGKIKK